MLKWDSYDLDTATRTVWGEARGEGKEGWAAVAWVIRNRAENPAWWGRTVATVCEMPYQFSCWNAKDPNSSKCAALSQQDPLYAQIEHVVLDVLRGRTADPTGGASHYCVTGLQPAWRKGRAADATIGHHEFFKLGPSA